MVWESGKESKKLKIFALFTRILCTSQPGQEGGVRQRPKKKKDHTHHSVKAFTQLGELDLWGAYLVGGEGVGDAHHSILHDSCMYCPAC